MDRFLRELPYFLYSLLTNIGFISLILMALLGIVLTNRVKTKFGVRMAYVNSVSLKEEMRLAKNHIIVLTWTNLINVVAFIYTADLLLRTIVELISSLSFFGFLGLFAIMIFLRQIFFIVISMGLMVILIFFKKLKNKDRMIISLVIAALVTFSSFSNILFDSEHLVLVTILWVSFFLHLKYIGKRHENPKKQEIIDKIISASSIDSLELASLEIKFESIPSVNDWMNYSNKNKFDKNTMKSSNQKAYDELERLHDLKEKNIISEEEYEMKKKKILNL